MRERVLIVAKPCPLSRSVKDILSYEGYVVSSVPDGDCAKNLFERGRDFDFMDRMREDERVDRRNGWSKSIESLKKKNKELQNEIKELKKFKEFVEQIAVTNGRIVSSMRLSGAKIARKRASGEFYVTEGGLGFAHMKKGEK